MTSEPFHDDYFGSFCIYCQNDYKTEAKLFTHVKRKHASTYAEAAVLKREAARA
jgi:hypothetical protein